MGLAVVGLLTRHLGTGGYGQYAVIVFYLSFFSIIADLGLYIILTKRISEPGADESYISSNIFTMRLLTAVLLLGAAPFIAILFPYAPIIKLGIALTTLSFLFNSLSQVLWGIFQKHLEVYKMAIAENVGRVILLVGTIAVVAMNGNLLWVMSTVVCGSFANFLVTFFWVRSKVRLQLTWDFRFWGEIMRDAWPIALSIVFNLVYFRLDGLLLAHFHSYNDVGIYGAPYKVLEVTVTLPAVVAGLVMPVLTRAYAEKNIQRFQTGLQRSVEALTLFAVPMVVGTWFIAGDLMAFISKEEFRISGDPLRPLILATGIIFLGNLFANTVVAINKQRAMIWGYGTVALISTIGYLIFIPPYSYMGAAWMTVVSEAMILIIAASMVLRTTHLSIQLTPLLKMLFSAAIMGGVLWWLSSDIPWFALIAIGALVYGVMIFLTRAVSKQALYEIVRLRPR